MTQRTTLNLFGFRFLSQTLSMWLKCVAYTVRGAATGAIGVKVLKPGPLKPVSTVGVTIKVQRLRMV